MTTIVVPIHTQNLRKTPHTVKSNKLNTLHVMKIQDIIVPTNMKQTTENPNIKPDHKITTTRGETDSTETTGHHFLEDTQDIATRKIGHHYLDDRKKRYRVTTPLLCPQTLQRDTSITPGTNTEDVIL